MEFKDVNDMNTAEFKAWVRENWSKTVKLFPKPKPKVKTIWKKRKPVNAEALTEESPCGKCETCCGGGPCKEFKEWARRKFRAVRKIWQD